MNNFILALKQFKNFKELIIVVIFLTIAGIEKFGFFKDNEKIDPFLIYVAVFVLYLTISLSFYAIKSRTAVKVGDFVDGLKRHFSSSHIPIFIRIVDNSIGQQAKTITKKIAASTFWDWTFICINQRGCEHFCNNLNNEIKTQYLSNPKIQTSTLSFVDQAITNGKNYIFFGNIICPPNLFKAEKFPSLPFDLDIDQNYSIYFDELYIYDTYLRNKRKVCSISNPHVTNDIRFINKTWKKLKTELEPATEIVCTWKNELVDPTKLELITQLIKERSLEQPCKQFISLNFEEKAKHYKIAAKSLLGKGIYYTLFYIGVLLSPFTLWNDTFINLPLSAALTAFLTFLYPLKVPMGIIFTSCYIFTNALGILLILIAGKKLKLIWQKPPLKAYLTFISYFIIASVIGYFVTGNNLSELSQNFYQLFQ